MIGAFMAAAVPQDPSPADTLRRQRRRATEVSEWYGVRLKVHKLGAFVELPVFAAQ